MELLGGTSVTPKAAPKVVARPVEVTSGQVSANIFRAYDIRGVVNDGLTEEGARKIGQSIGSEAFARGEQVVLVGRDGRLSSPQMSAALIEGLLASGRDVIDVGMVPTPVLYFAAKTMGTGTGVMVTGSHNPGNYNGFKMVFQGRPFFGADIQQLGAMAAARQIGPTCSIRAIRVEVSTPLQRSWNSRGPGPSGQPPTSARAAAAASSPPACGQSRIAYSPAIAAPAYHTAAAGRSAASTGAVQAPPRRPP